MLLKCKDLIKIYPSPVEGLRFPALRGLNLAIKKGDFVSIIGPSGAGKSTFLRLISSYDTPSSGEIWFNGQLVNSFSYRELLDYRLKIGIMNQSSRDNLIWNFNVLDNVMLPMRYSGLFLGKQKERARELLDRVRLLGKEKRKPSQLSGGEQQRVSIAVALANNPCMILADEPTGELDSQSTGMIIDYFKQLNNETGLTIIVVTHDKRFSNATKSTYKIQDGRITTYKYQASRNIDNEVVVVDSHGNLRLPSKILSKFKGLTSVKITIKGNEMILSPINRNENN
ncbi:MAG: ABC transporter ATP-binding protein [Candidatus Hodarchaeales archaeon]